MISPPFFAAISLWLIFSNAVNQEQFNESKEFGYVIGNSIICKYHSLLNFSNFFCKLKLNNWRDFFLIKKKWT